MSFDGRRDAWRIPLSRVKISDFVFSKLNGSGLRSLLLSDYRLLWLKDWFLLLLFLLLFRRGSVVRVDSAGPSTGSVLLSPDKRRLVWDVGKLCRLRHYFTVGLYWNTSICRLKNLVQPRNASTRQYVLMYIGSISKDLNVYLILLSLIQIWRKKCQF